MDYLASMILHDYPRATGPPVDIVTIVRQEGVWVYPIPFRDGRLAGAFKWVQPTGCKPCPVIVVNKRHSWKRQRFTIAHEFYHYLNDLPHAEAKLSYKPGAPAPERQANKFAAALLMPKDIVTKMMQDNLTVAEIANTLAVSKTALEIRLKELKLT